MQKTNDCPSNISLAEFFDGHLDGPELTQIADHLESCIWCQRTLQSLTSSDTVVESLRGGATAVEQAATRLPDSLLNKLQQIPQSESGLGYWNHKFDPQNHPLLEELKNIALPVSHPSRGGRLGHYRILDLLATGGMGEVFKAQDTQLHRPVALKVMLPIIAADPSAKDRFLREARAAASLNCDHIVKVYHVGEDTGLPFIATELLQGESLEAAIRGGRKFSVNEVVRIARDILLGLSVAHASGIVHRDIKPANLWLETISGDNFRVKILDFGLARADLDESQLTHASAIVGTPAFMPPEQARGSKAIDFRSDLFSVGCVLYLLCADQLPFQGETTIETLMAIAMSTPKSPELIRSDVPPELGKLVMELLEKDPKNRPDSADSVISRLDGLDSLCSMQRSSQAMVALAEHKSSNTIEPVASPSRNRYWGPIAVAVALIGVVFWASFAVFYWETPNGRIVRVECNDPNIQVAFGDGELRIANAYTKPLVVQPGAVELKIKKLEADGSEFVFESDKLVIKKGDAIALKIELLDKRISIEQIGKGIIDSKEISPDSFNRPELTADQRAALWVLSIGGKVSLKDLEWIQFEEQLPTKDYQVTGIDLGTSLLVTDDGLKNLNGLTELTMLNLDSTKVSDEGLAHLKDLVQLNDLRLFGTKITDAGILHLKNMTQLSRLCLGGRLQITDASILQIRRFDQLKQLHLDTSKITDAALPLLRRLEHLELLDLGGTMVTDEGIESVIYIESLKELVLYNTKITDESMRGISRMKNLEVLSFWLTSISDAGLDHLHRLTNLKYVAARKSHITKDGLARFHQALPNCEIGHSVPDSPIPSSGTPYPPD
jgi:serine/threonine protein kinase